MPYYFTFGSGQPHQGCYTTIEAPTAEDARQEMTNQKRERPVLFRGEMVRAILDGTKTQTRRVVKPQPQVQPDGALYCETRPVSGYSNERTMQEILPLYCPYGEVGDRLWVRETFVQGWPSSDGDILQWDEEGNELPKTTWYRATDDIEWYDEDAPDPAEAHVPWKPSIHMPRSASRITLEIVSVRVERVQDISAEDAIAEGIVRQNAPPPYDGMDWCSIPGDDRDYRSPREAFRHLWDSINTSRGFSWESNPWTWVIEFRPL